jgi:magnesium-protoporphyrin IX monomethyl ester (oxidative) cyclase
MAGNRLIDSILREFVLHLQHTFGQGLLYVGTTTDLATAPSNIRDIDVMIVLKQASEAHVAHVWRIIRKLQVKYPMYLDVRIYTPERFPDIPTTNKYLLRRFLIDLIGKNPFSNFEVPAAELREACLQRIKQQETLIVSLLPRIAYSAVHVRDVAQAVYDAIRSFLIIEGAPLAGKEQACAHIQAKYPKFSEAATIYQAFLDPQSILDIPGFIVESLALVKHLYYRAACPPMIDGVLLINTPSSIFPHPRDDYLSYDHNMPLGLVCVASFLAQKGVPVTILDSYGENLGALATVERIFTGIGIPRIIGFNACSPNAHVVHRLARDLKRIRGDLVLLCGGAHPSLATDHTLSTSDIDFAILGEGEVPCYRLVTHLLHGGDKASVDIPGVCKVQDGRVVGDPKSELLDLAQLPAPNLGLLPLGRYFSVRKRVYVHTSRGCAFNCIYCSVPGMCNHKVREIPLETVIAQLAELLEKYKPEQVQIVDDNFSHKRGKIIKAFCEQVLNRGLKFSWKCQLRADQLDRDTVDLMRRSGCFEVDLGIESGSVEIQKYIRKGLDLEKTRDVVGWIRDQGIVVKAFLMLGFPRESYSQIAQTINYAISLKAYGLKDVAFFPVMPFPGTEISRETGITVHQGAVIDDAYSHERSFAAQRLRKYSARPEVSLSPFFTAEQLRLLVKFAYHRFQSGHEVQNLEEEFKAFVSEEEYETYAA